MGSTTCFSLVIHRSGVAVKTPTQLLDQPFSSARHTCKLARKSAQQHHGCDADSLQHGHISSLCDCDRLITLSANSCLSLPPRRDSSIRSFHFSFPFQFTSFRETISTPPFPNASSSLQIKPTTFKPRRHFGSLSSRSAAPGRFLVHNAQIHLPRLRAPTSLVAPCTLGHTRSI